jgi:predicted RNA polymerase sigma factor
MGTAKHRAIDLCRRNKRLARKYEELGHELQTQREMGVPDLDTIDDHIGDDLLRLVFTACHPLLSTEARVALTLRLLGGLTTEEIARAFLVPAPTIAQRIVRAKRTLREARVPFEVPAGGELAVRLSSVLEAGMTGCGLRFARMPSVSAASWQSWPHTNRRSTAWWR